MKLEVFVAETLEQIINGILSAQQHAVKAGGIVCPLHLPTRDAVGNRYDCTYRRDTEHPIEFDVAVTTTETSKAGGGVGIFVAPIALGSKREEKDTAEYVSRIKFAIPVVYPKQNDPTMKDR